MNIEQAKQLVLLNKDFYDIISVDSKIWNSQTIYVVNFKVVSWVTYKGSEAQLKKNTYFFAREAGADKRSEKKTCIFW